MQAELSGRISAPPTFPRADRPGADGPIGETSGDLRSTFDGELFETAQALITSRSNVSPKRLVEPGPSPQQFEALMSLAAAAPDHGLLTPWRFIVVPAAQRQRLAEVFALALIDRDPGATLQQIESAREKAYRAPLLMVAVACLGPREPDIPRLERMISMGAAVQNLLLGAHAMGFGAGLTSGQAMKSKRMHQLCGLAHEEWAVCCVNIGTVSKRKSVVRSRPQPAGFVTELREFQPVS
jgi:nitroreductase